MTRAVQMATSAHSMRCLTQEYLTDGADKYCRALPMGDESALASRNVSAFEKAQWRPGVSGNPSGRPPGIAALRAKLDGERLRLELEAFAYGSWDDPAMSRLKLEALKLLTAYKYGPPGPLPEDMTVKDALLSMSLDKARELMEGDK